jgi:threonylcarbamoyladenosine tRNA methylthiotransferase MtaB
MPQVAGPAVKERAARLRRKGGAALAAWLEAQVGRSEQLLMESADLGRTPGFAEVEIDGGVGASSGTLVNVLLTGSDGLRLRGRPLAPKCAP